jgi:hypothetical protein
VVDPAEELVGRFLLGNHQSCEAENQREYDPKALGHEICDLNHELLSCGFRLWRKRSRRH